MIRVLLVEDDMGLAGNIDYLSLKTWYVTTLQTV